MGKTTLCKTLVGKMPPKTGEVRWGHNVRVGYFGENHREDIEPGHTVFDWLHAERPDMDQQDVRAILGRMLFSGEDGRKPTATLSGGEAARLMFCKLIIKQYNVLVLDEPTNHLDLESISALKEAIEQFPGTIFYVTHDRDLAAAANRVLAYPEPGVLARLHGQHGRVPHLVRQERPHGAPRELKLRAVSPAGRRGPGRRRRDWHDALQAQR